jgi:hypothetical protein
MSVYFDTLKELKQSRELVDLYRDHVSDESLTGVVTDYTRDFVYLSLVSDAGLPNGIAVVFLADVTRIRWGGNVRASILQLMREKKSALLAPVLRLGTLEDVLSSVNELFGYVNVLTERMNGDVTFIGEIGKMDGQALLLYAFGAMTTRDRNHMLLRLDEITRVDAEAQYERDIKALMATR